MASKKLFAAILLCLALSACERMKIGDVTADPGRFKDKEINVAGKVTNFSVGVLGRGLYQIDDGTGKLYVLSEKNGAPREGAYVGVKGRLLPSVTILGKNYATVLRESDRKAVKASD
ncbi:MAG TPA: hypothetical protein VFY29_18945 [Terriglobia bacterium]|nr:hypothetical protein [Terriglobia bacterium]